MNLPASRTALLVIDVQRGLFDPEPFEAGPVIERINALVARARAAGVPVVWVQHEEADGLEAGSPAWQLHPDLAAQDSDPRVRKREPDSFADTGLQSLLAGRGIERLVVSGYASDCCVDATTRGASSRGYAVTLAADAHTTHDQPEMSGGEIRAQRTRTLCALEGGGPVVAVDAADIAFE